MGKAAKDRRPIGGDLPAAGHRAPVSGLPLRAVLDLPSLAQSRLLGPGAEGATGVGGGAGRGDADGAAAAACPDVTVLRPRLLASATAVVPFAADREVVLLGDLACPDAGTVCRLLAQAERAGAVAVLVPAEWGRSAAVGEHAAALEVPVLALPGSVTAAAAALQIYAAVLERQSAILDREEQVHRTLVQIVLAGGSITDLCEQLVSFFDGAAMVTTSDGRVLTSAGSAQQVHQALALDCFDRSGRFVVEDEPVGARRLGGRPAHRVMVRIVAGSSDHGRLVAFCSHRGLGADDVHLLERAATVAALAITKEQAVSAVEGKYRAEFLRDALAGRAGSAEQAIDHASSLGWDISRHMVVVVAETDEDDDTSDRPQAEIRALQERFARAWTGAVTVRDPGAPVIGFSREVVALLRVEPGAGTEAVLRQVGDVVRVVRGDGGGGRRRFSTGVSRTLHTPDQLPQAYDEARGAVVVGRQLHGEGALSHFDGLGVYRLLALIPDSADLHRFVGESLGELAGDTTAESQDLRRTLEVLLETNCNVAQTARLLFFHYNTLRYRIAKLERLLGPFMSDPQLRFTLALALKVRQMRGI